MSSDCPHSATPELPAQVDLGQSQQQQQQYPGMAITHPLTVSQLPQPSATHLHQTAPPGEPESLSNAGPTAPWTGTGGGGTLHQGETSSQLDVQQQLQQTGSWDMPPSSHDHPQAGVASDLAISQQQQQATAALSSTTPPPPSNLPGYYAPHQEMPPHSEDPSTLFTFSSTHPPPDRSTHQQQFQPPPPSNFYQPSLPQEAPDSTFSFPPMSQEGVEAPTDRTTPRGISISGSKNSPHYFICADSQRWMTRR